MILDYDNMTIGELADLGRIAKETCALEFTAQTGHKGLLTGGRR